MGFISYVCNICGIESKRLPGSISKPAVLNDKYGWKRMNSRYCGLLKCKESQGILCYNCVKTAEKIASAQHRNCTTRTGNSRRRKRKTTVLSITKAGAIDISPCSCVKTSSCGTSTYEPTSQKPLHLLQSSHWYSRVSRNELSYFVIFR